MSTTKYSLKVETKDVVFDVRVKDNATKDLIVFEGSNKHKQWSSKLCVIKTDEVFAISCDSSGLLLTGFIDGKEVYNVFCNDDGEITYKLPYEINVSRIDPIKDSISLEDTLKQDPVFSDAVADIFVEKLNETPFMKKLNAVRAIVKSVNDGLLINMNIVNNLDMTMKVGMDVEKIVTNYKSTHPTSTEDDIVKHVIEYCRLNTIPNYVQQALEQGMTPEEICKKHVLTRQDVDWYLWLFDAYDKLFDVSNKEREGTTNNNQGVKVDKDSFMTIEKISSEDKLSLLNAMIARIHDKQGIANIVNELNISTSIVTTVMCAYNSLKPISGGTTGNIYVLIDYIVKNRIVDSIKTSVEQNDTVEQTARFSNISIYEADWFIWFVKTSKENMKI